MPRTTAFATLTTALLASAALATPAFADDPPSSDDSASAVRIKLRQGTGTARKGVTGYVLSSNTDCVEGQRVTFYRQTIGSGGDVIGERKAGYVIAQAIAEGAKKSRLIKFGLVRDGRIIARTAASDDCLAGKSNVVNYRRPVAGSLFALAAAKTATRLSIQTEADGFSGFVKSTKSSCHSGRKVVLYRKVPGPDKKAGSDTAQPNQDGSQWKISVSRDGTYYAKVGATSKCAGKTSKALKSNLVDDGEGASAAQGDDGPAFVRIALRQGIGDYRKGVLGRVFSTNPDCVTGAQITIYRRKLSFDGNSVVETKVGTSTVKALPGGKLPAIKYKKYNFKYGLVRSGSIVAKTAGSDTCKAARSNPVSYSRPL